MLDFGLIEVVDGDGCVIQDGQQICPNVENLRRRTPQAFNDIFQMVVLQLSETLLHLLGGQQFTADAERGAGAAQHIGDGGDQFIHALAVIAAAQLVKRSSNKSKAGAVMFGLSQISALFVRQKDAVAQTEVVK